MQLYIENGELYVNGIRIENAAQQVRPEYAAGAHFSEARAQGLVSLPC